jgi:serine/threonine protein phosphatase 1
MFTKLRSLFSSARSDAAPEAPAAFPARLPDGQRVYAIGDIHGRLDLFEQLLARIDEDDAERGPAETSLVLLGDLIDRGPASRGVVERAIGLSLSGKVRILAGNHEEMLLSGLENEDVLRHFLRHGGKETLFSYGLTPEEYSAGRLDQLRERAAELVPADHLAFMRAMEDQVIIGDYLFVHAGIRPDLALDRQVVSDLRWIRRDFLDHPGLHSHMVVHGHSITDQPDVRPNRIGIDTGAFNSGRLTALGLEGGERWFLSAVIEPERQPEPVAAV